MFIKILKYYIFKIKIVKQMEEKIQKNMMSKKVELSYKIFLSRLSISIYI